MSRAALALLLAACAAPARTPPAAAVAPSAPPAGAPAPPSTARDPWWKGAVVYQVYVRSFADSDGDGIGDLPGLVAHLDALNDGDPASGRSLGVDALWLMPIFPSPSPHGYDVTDFDHVNPPYGTDADLQRLLAEAHRRGMKVILDLPLNHTSDQHPWFVDSASGPASPRRDWYEWSEVDPGWRQPWDLSTHAWHPRGGAFYYGLYGGWMPDLNYRTPAVREELKAVAARWLARGVDGFRLDALRYLVETGRGRGQVSTPETHALVKELAASIHAARPDALLVGEVWSIAEEIADYYGDGKDELDLAFDFPLADAFVSGVNGGRADGIAGALRAARRAYPAGAQDAPFLANHDQLRIATRLGNDPAKLRLAAALLLTVPGTAFVYQGEELGQENGPGGDDREKRTPLPWTGTPPGFGFTAGQPWFHFGPGAAAANVAAEEGDPRSLRAWYRTLVAARHRSPALSRGELTLLDAPGAPRAALAFLRQDTGKPGGTVLVVHNLGDASADTGVLAAPGEHAEPLIGPAQGEARLVREGEGWRATLPPRGSAAWRLR
jgi:glycosidase